MPAASLTFLAMAAIKPQMSELSTPEVSETLLRTSECHWLCSAATSLHRMAPMWLLSVNTLPQNPLPGSQGLTKALGR